MSLIKRTVVPRCEFRANSVSQMLGVRPIGVPISSAMPDINALP